MPVAQALAFRPFRSDKARERYLAHCEVMEKSWPIDSEARSVFTDAELAGEVSDKVLHIGQTRRLV